MATTDPTLRMAPVWIPSPSIALAEDLPAPVPRRGLVSVEPIFTEERAIIGIEAQQLTTWPNNSKKDDTFPRLIPREAKK